VQYNVVHIAFFLSGFFQLYAALRGRFALTNRLVVMSCSR